MNNFKQTYIENWLHILYKDFPIYFKKSKNNLIRQAYITQNLKYKMEDIVYFKGIAYSAATAPFASNPQRIDLVGIHAEQMEKLFQEKVDIANEQVIVQGYLSRILNLSVYPADVDILLPENIKDHLTCWNKKRNVYGTTISENKQVLFKAKNKQFSDLISECILTSLLLNL